MISIVKFNIKSIRCEQMVGSRPKNWRRCDSEILDVRQGVAKSPTLGSLPLARDGGQRDNCTMLERAERKFSSAVGEDGLLRILGSQGVDCNEHLWF